MGALRFYTGKACKLADSYAGKNDHSSLEGKMAIGNFRLKAKVSSDNLPAIKPTLERLIADKGTIRETDQGFDVEAELQGESARALNRMILSELRKAEKRTRIRAEWTSGSIIERFFDYVPKGTSKAEGNETAGR